MLFPKKAKTREEPIQRKGGDQLRKIVQTMLLVTLLATGFCLVPPIKASPGNVYFHYKFEGAGGEIDFNFWFDATATKPNLPFGGTGSLRINLQPDKTRIRIEGETIEGRRVWEETFDTAPVGEEDFRFEVNEGGIEAIILGVEATTIAKASVTEGRLSISGSGINEWDEAGTGSFIVTAPFGAGSDVIKVKWNYEWKVRFGLTASGYGTIYGDWVEMEELEASTTTYQVGYGYGFLLVGLIVIVAIPVALLIRRRRKLKPELESKPELIQESKPSEINCRSCGSPVSMTSEYCDNCGTKIEEKVGF